MISLYHELPVAISSPVERFAAASGVDIEDILAPPRCSIKLVFIRPHAPFRIACHRVYRHSPQKADAVAGDARAASAVKPFYEYLKILGIAAGRFPLYRDGIRLPIDESLYLSMACRNWRSARRSSASRSRFTELRTIGMAAAVRIERIVMAMMISRSVNPFWTSSRMMRFAHRGFGFWIDELQFAHSNPCYDNPTSRRTSPIIQNPQSKII